ncbi:hypothetical protein DPEC_G00364650 [Dallia pectoralis]|nr:hypothetical protein DPEC_G00364650 [Dallia pectoralis]
MNTRDTESHLPHRTRLRVSARDSLPENTLSTPQPPCFSPIHAELCGAGGQSAVSTQCRTLSRRALRGSSVHTQSSWAPELWQRRAAATAHCADLKTLFGGRCCGR